MPRLLDLFCGAGGSACGYQRAGFYVVGVDNKFQPRYHGDEFLLCDALEYVREHGAEFDAIHASPQCQGYSVTQHIHGRDYPMQIEQVREALCATGKPYVIENVIGAPLDGITLCGTMFGLRVIRHRKFESSILLMQPPHSRHQDAHTNSQHGYSAFRLGADYITVAGHNFDPVDGGAAMGIDWMNRDELAEALPPVYCEWIGAQLMRVLETLR